MYLQGTWLIASYDPEMWTVGTFQLNWELNQGTASHLPHFWAVVIKSCSAADHKEMHDPCSSTSVIYNFIQTKANYRLGQHNPQGTSINMRFFDVHALWPINSVVWWRLKGGSGYHCGLNWISHRRESRRRTRFMSGSCTSLGILIADFQLRWFRCIQRDSCLTMFNGECQSLTLESVHPACVLSHWNAHIGAPDWDTFRGGIRRWLFEECNIWQPEAP